MLIICLEIGKIAVLAVADQLFEEFSLITITSRDESELDWIARIKNVEQSFDLIW